MTSKDQLLYDTRNVNKSCDILSINYKHPITLTDKFEDFNGTSVEQKYTWNSPAAYIYSSLLHYAENKISLNNYEPETLADVHKQLIEKETIYISERILNNAIMNKLNANTKFKEKLIATGNKKIVYSSLNTLLGNGKNNDGRNLLGKCYMKQRETIQKENQEQAESELISKAKEIINKINNYYNNAIKLLREYEELFKAGADFTSIDKIGNLVQHIKKVIEEQGDQGDQGEPNSIYTEYMNNNLPYGVNNIINSLKISDLNSFDSFDDYKEKIITIVLKEHIGEYVNSITGVRDRDIMQKYISFIIGEKFTVRADASGKTLDQQVIDKITEDVAIEQNEIFNEDGNICTKKIPQRLVELYKNHRDNTKDNEGVKSFKRFMNIMDGIMTNFNKYNPSETIIKDIMNFSIDDSDTTLLEKILDSVNLQNTNASEELVEIDTASIFSPTNRKSRPGGEEGSVDYLVHNDDIPTKQPRLYPDITSYYFVEMLKFINNATNSQDYYDLIVSETGGFKSTVELSKLFNKNYAEITEEKLANALVRILNVKFTCCSISCAALDALLELPKKSAIIWGSSNTILGMNNKMEGKNLVGKYLTQIRASVEYRNKTALNSSSGSDQVKNALSDEYKRKLFINCVDKFKYQLNLYETFKTIFQFDIDNQDLHNVNCCKKFMMLLFSNCDILHLIANNRINFTKITNKITSLSMGDIFQDKTPPALIQWFWGFFILIATNVSDKIVEVIINKDSQNKPNENFKNQQEEYIKNFVLTIISVLYYFVNVYVNKPDNDNYVEFSYDKTIQFIKVIVFNDKDQVLDQTFDNPLNDAYLNNFYGSCKDCVGLSVDANDKIQFKSLLNRIKAKSTEPKTQNLIVYFNNPQFIFNRDINMPINA